jgi:hypothetical protein
MTICSWCTREATVELGDAETPFCATCAGLLAPYLQSDDPEQALEALHEATISFEQHLARVYRNPTPLPSKACWWCGRPGELADTARVDRDLVVYQSPILCPTCAAVSGHIDGPDAPERALEAAQAMFLPTAADQVSAFRERLLQQIHRLIEHTANDPEGDLEGADEQTRLTAFAASMLQLIEGGELAPGYDGGPGSFIIPRALNMADYSRGLADGWPDMTATARDLCLLPGGLADRLILTEPFPTIS